MRRGTRLLALVATVLVLAMSMRAGQTQAARAGAAKVNLVMWWWGDQEAAGAAGWLKRSIALYEKLHPNITITQQLQTTTGLYPKFEAAAATRKGPDIQYLWGGINTLTESWRGYMAPISDYIPPSELKHYLNKAEETYGGKVWSAPWYTQPSFPLIYNKALFRKAGLNPNSPPRTWTQFMAACAALKAHGIIPLAGGVQDGFFGGWLFAMLGDQNLNDSNDIKKAVVGQADFGSQKYMEWWSRLHDTYAKGYWNRDVTSLALYQGQALWSEGKAAMTWVAGSDLRRFVRGMGVANTGIMETPIFGSGRLAHRYGSTSQTLGITAWSQHKTEAAQFIMYLHTRERMIDFYNTTGSIPADDRFPTNLITLPQQREMWGWMVNTPGAYIENFIPLDLDNNGNFPGVQEIFNGKPVSDVIKLQLSVLNTWKQTKQPEFHNFQGWVTPY